MTLNISNIDKKVVKDFGSEWARFDQSMLSEFDHEEMFWSYFDIFPWNSLPDCAVGADIGCGSGRWGRLVAPRVGILHMIDPSSEALSVAADNLVGIPNVKFHNSSVDSLPFDSQSLDFAYALGVFHHVPNTLNAIQSVSRILKPGAPFLIYLYYSFDNRPIWFRALWSITNCFRLLISKLPTPCKNIACDLIAALIYWPMSRIARFLDRINLLPNSWPLSYYRYRQFYVLRTDALDRFGTRLERRFTKIEIEEMLKLSGFTNVTFSNNQPFWCAVAYKQ